MFVRGQAPCERNSKESGEKIIECRKKIAPISRTKEENSRGRVHHHEGARETAKNDLNMKNAAVRKKEVDTVEM